MKLVILYVVIIVSFTAYVLAGDAREEHDFMGKCGNTRACQDEWRSQRPDPERTAP